MTRNNSSHARSRAIQHKDRKDRSDSCAEQQFVLDVMEIVDHLKDIAIERIAAMRWRELKNDKSRRGNHHKQ